MSMASGLRDLVAYVPQDDTLLADVTVRENVRFSAHVWIGNLCGSQDIVRHVDSLILVLDLEKVQNSLVGDVSKRVLSGDERKRVNIALELVTAPKVLALNEPTLGLDATTALDLMKLLEKLARKEMSIICALHQPRAEIFALIDDSLLLQAGKQIYLGQAKQALRHLEGSGTDSLQKINPADAIMDALVRSQHRYNPLLWGFKGIQDSSITKEAIAAREETIESVEALLVSIRQRRTSWYQQVMLVFMREITQQSRQTGSLCLEIISGAIIGMVIGLSYYVFRGHLFQGLFQSVAFRGSLIRGELSIAGGTIFSFRFAIGLSLLCQT
ncbi:ABC transporter [Penicillium antarcticum]|uniref:ABC transporter n=1 Tax=Penicillium antarcticum TaxID=416450 RepID=UPI00239FE1A5|nr:ABC transporter [Penicillium antarcticum]KAJ5316494.1 ABC transporter [Penicillium antarcticum]